ncbi:aminotransferase class I/II-fold pyridoxal phosphate-dependent enzyme [Saxibacter everestensis]|uniref:Aminotransferase class I/II-fold pyridoxal phosphate-dependent enzyme n=1 Tax=Saxibacter everestensis TaxID=2909229 RepID=A0ABY8QX36_9MICO|nr:aminotransferase class I/II-fold pyridoxal phosphate-dependent enzyme [Brevibacteriaceae bacterium ZFBP1038]
MALATLTPERLTQLHSELKSSYEALKDRDLKLDLTRGKPSPAQLDLSADLLTIVGPDSYTSAEGTDTRNYGGLDGLVELREIFAELLNVPVDLLLAQGSSSLTLMYNTMSFAMLHGVSDQATPWIRSDNAPKILCPSPGYDRHFALCESLGIELVPVAMLDDGPDLEAVRALVANDPAVKGIWAVPAYSNPTGAVFGEDITRELLAMPTAADDFRIFWDNAYGLHHLTDDEAPVLDVLDIAAEAGHPDRVFIFASTSKMTFAGAGVSFWGSSPANVAWFKRHLAAQSIGPDKINQLRHARFFGDAAGVRAHMARHRAIIEPKFAIVHKVLEDRLGDSGVAHWSSPRGGYFVSLDVLPGTADRVVSLAKDVGVAMTPAGAAFPYGNDPEDKNIRIAPTMPTEDDVAVAIDVLATCVLLAAAEKLAA